MRSIFFLNSFAQLVLSSSIYVRVLVSVPVHTTHPPQGGHTRGLQPPARRGIYPRARAFPTRINTCGLQPPGKMAPGNCPEEMPEGEMRSGLITPSEIGELKRPFLAWKRHFLAGKGISRIYCGVYYPQNAIYGYFGLGSPIQWFPSLGATDPGLRKRALRITRASNFQRLAAIPWRRNAPGPFPALNTNATRYGTTSTTARLYSEARPVYPWAIRRSNPKKANNYRFLDLCNHPCTSRPTHSFYECGSCYFRTAGRRIQTALLPVPGTLFEGTGRVPPRYPCRGYRRVPGVPASDYTNDSRILQLFIKGYRLVFARYPTTGDPQSRTGPPRTIEGTRRNAAALLDVLLS